MELPRAYTDKIKDLIGESGLACYEKALSGPSVHGLRANRLKISAAELNSLLKDKVRLDGAVPWCDDGFYFESDPDMMPGKTAYYHAGLYYIQEPSAMYPAANALIKPGERVLDLCAAPGGKSLRAASDLAGTGLLVSNDINATRAGTLLYNLELGGVPNIIVTNETPLSLAERFGAFFDAVLVDAPCSGEGMFRKDQDALGSWETFKTEKCTEMQKNILASAALLVRPGGRIVYSTCTFDKRENEGMIASFLKDHCEFSLSELPKTDGIVSGYAAETVPDLEKTVRLWPQNLRGEGQFAAMLVRSGDGPDVNYPLPDSRHGASGSYRRLKTYPEELKEFASENLTSMPFENASFFTMGDKLYASSFGYIDIDRLKVLRMGLQIGEISHGKLRPSQHFIMSVDRGSFRNKAEIDPDGIEVRKYLRGETLDGVNAENGFCAVTVSGYQLGGGEVRNGIMKNLYPKGWRRLI